ncbi:response regulator [Bradyrhizobium ontarionense]|uniref:Response regulator n=1 Tax=Bradyrhizobium ontarionense TaxID=2898149 RepID=A0ABY3RM60_9BRAD|nr:response regulator [Bradyrhizobium sp. A19]UFZ07980.1 response regulator [Bradyrhizobium sp. A19]
MRKPARPLTRVLVIDDDCSVSTAIQAILAGRHCETAIASRAYAGIRALQQSIFDVVMLDIFMPGLNGLDVIEHIRRSSLIPIIVMSGFRLRSSTESVDYLGLAKQRGATLCMPKPFQAVQLIEAVESTLCSPCLAEGPRS